MVYTYTNLVSHVPVYVCVHMHTCMYTQTENTQYIYIYTSLYIYMYMCTYICIYIYIEREERERERERQRVTDTCLHMHIPASNITHERVHHMEFGKKARISAPLSRGKILVNGLLVNGFCVRIQ